MFIYFSFYASHQKPELWNHLVYLGWQVYKNPIIMYTLSSLLCFAARPLLAKFARLKHCVKRRAIRSNQTNLHYPRIHLEGSKEGKSTSEHILSCSHQADQEWMRCSTRPRDCFVASSVGAWWWPSCRWTCHLSSSRFVADPLLFRLRAPRLSRNKLQACPTQKKAQTKRLGYRSMGRSETKPGTRPRYFV
jgi:hypothetical protein